MTNWKLWVRLEFNQRLKGITLPALTLSYKLDNPILRSSNMKKVNKKLKLDVLAL